MSIAIDVLPETTRALALAILRAARACRRAQARLAMPVSMTPYHTAADSMLVFLEVAGCPLVGVDVRDVPHYAETIELCLGCGKHAVTAIPHTCGGDA